MSRRPITTERLAQLLLTEPFIRAVKIELTAAAKKTLEQYSDGSNRPPSRRRDLLDEPSTGTNKKPPPKRPPNYKRALQEMTAYGDQVVKGLWECSEPRHLIGLYASLHVHLYATPALELQQDYGGALASATKLVKDEFAGNCLAAQGYVAWCIARAKKWKQQSEKDETEVVRVGWRLLFKGRKWLVDWKASGRR